MANDYRDMIKMVEEDIDLGFLPPVDDKDYNISASDNISSGTKSSKKKEKKVFSVNINGDVSDNSSNSTLPVNYKTTYNETDNLLRSAIGQMDELAFEIQKDVMALRKSPTARNKYNNISGLIATQASLIGNKISAIREMNNTITKSHELEFKRIKEMKMDATATDDNKMIMDLYSNMISNPQFTNPLAQSYSQVNPTINSGNLMTANGPQHTEDPGFNNYMNSLSPEQNMMLLESNPNVEEVICYDPMTGNAYFDVVDVSTGESVPNTPKKSAVFLDNTTLDLQDMIGRNNKLNQSWRIVMVGPGKYTAPKIIESY